MQNALMFIYTSPLVILAALSLLLCFNGMRFKSKFINWIAASSFAIYLLHTHPNLNGTYYKPIVRTLYEQYSGPTCILAILGFLTVVTITAILIDQLRKLIWKRLICRIWFSE